jgi:hypothetical protein
MLVSWIVAMSVLADNAVLRSELSFSMLTCITKTLTYSYDTILILILTLIHTIHTIYTNHPRRDLSFLSITLPPYTISYFPTAKAQSFLYFFSLFSKSADLVYSLFPLVLGVGGISFKEAQSCSLRRFWR